MLFMVIEHFKHGALRAIGERFREEGRMLPARVSYHASWVDTSGSRCFQLMEAPDRELLDEWMRRWGDLVEFEAVEVLPSAEFWSKL